MLLPMKVFQNQTIGVKHSSEVTQEDLLEGLQWWHSGWGSVLSPLRAQVRSLVGELRSSKLHGQKKKKKIGKTSSDYAISKIN